MLGVVGVRVRNLRSARFLMTSTYNKDAARQVAVFQASTPLLLTAIEKMRLQRPAQSPIIVADLGAAGGLNSLALVSFVVNALRSSGDMNDICVYHEDLPQSDFNTLAATIAKADVGDRVYFRMIPKSFYERLFPSQTVDLVTSMITLHWVSSIPCSLPGTLVFCGDREYMATTSDPHLSPDVLQAWRKQAESDLVNFFALRACELRGGGQLVVSMVGGPGVVCDKGDGQRLNFAQLFDCASLVVTGVLSTGDANRLAFGAYLRSLEDVEAAVSQVKDLYHESGEIKTVAIKYEFASGFELADFFLSIHFNQVMACVKPTSLSSGEDYGEAEPHPPLHRLIRESIASKIKHPNQLRWTINYHIVSLSRR
jgi:hypothetical protein